MKLISLLNCARYDLVTRTVPCNCQWFGAKGFSRLDVQISTGEGVLTVLLVAVLLWRCLSPPSNLSVVGALLGVAGAVVGGIRAIYGATSWGGCGVDLQSGWRHWDGVA